MPKPAHSPPILMCCVQGQWSLASRQVPAVPAPLAVGLSSAVVVSISPAHSALSCNGKQLVFILHEIPFMYVWLVIKLPPGPSEALYTFKYIYI